MQVADFDAILLAPFGSLGVCVVDGRLRRLEFLPPGVAVKHNDDPLIQRLAAQLAVYYADPGAAFDLPLDPVGTDFRKRVWQALRAIPPGRLTTYGSLARQLGSSARAVGQALGDNPLPIVVPCHRVIAADGRLGGFNHSATGYTVDIKRWLLAHESAA